MTEACAHAHIPQREHEYASQQMADAEQPLGLHILVGNDAHERGHKDGHNALNGIEPRNLSAKTGNAKIVAHASEISSPNAEFEEVHYG